VQPPERPVVDQPVLIPAGRVTLEGLLTVPPGARGVVAFAHGSGSGRLSPATSTWRARSTTRGLATLLLDLLTAVEEADLDSDALRRGDALPPPAGGDDWLAARSPRPGCRWACSAPAPAPPPPSAPRPRGPLVGAVVSRGGRPDLARDWPSRPFARPRC
jgi:putative phosphoribosyl transferase